MSKEYWINIPCITDVTTKSLYLSKLAPLSIRSDGISHNVTSFI